MTRTPSHPRRPGRTALEFLEPRETPALFVAGAVQTFTPLDNNGLVVVADFNRDGRDDIVVTNYGSPDLLTGKVNPGKTLTVLFGQGDGTFGGPATLTVGTDHRVAYVAAGDVDGDAVLDLVAVSNAGADDAGYLTVFRGDDLGLGTFAKVGQVKTGGQNSAWVGLARLSADAAPDVVVASFGFGDAAAGTVAGNNVTVFQGDGKGGFDPVQTIATGVSFIPTAGALADFTGDGKADLAVTVPGVPADANADQPNGSVQVFPGTGGGGFDPDSANAFDSGGALPQGLAVGLFNADGRPDLAVSNAGDPDQKNLGAGFGKNSSVGVLLNAGSGNFAAPARLFDGIAAGGSKSVFSVTTGDFDGDGKTDIAAVTYGSLLGTTPSRVPVFLGDGTGKFAAAAGSSFETEARAGQHIAVGKFDANGSPDLVVVGAADEIVTLLNQSAAAPGAVATTTALAPPPAAGTYGTGFTLTATVSAASGTPAGTVTFLNGSAVLGTADLAAVGGQQVAAFDVPGTALGVGVYNTLSARYEGATGFATSTSGPASRTVTPAAAAVALSADPTRVTVGGSVTFTATVSSAAGAPGGRVGFFEGATQIGGPVDLAAVGGKQVATFTTPDLAAGDHAVTAKYLGAANYAAAESAAVTVAVEATSSPPPPPGPAATTTALESAVNPSAVGQPVAFTAVVTAAAGTPAGSVSLYDGAALVGGPLNLTTVGGRRQVTFTIGWLAAGSHPLVARYAGTAAFTASDSNTVVQQVNAPAAATTTTLTAGPSPAAFGQAVTLTAVVAAGAGTPGGQVEFYRGTTRIGSAVNLATVGGKRQAAVVVAGGDLPVGDTTLTAKYLGATGFAASDSPAVPLRVDPATPDVVLSGGGSSVVGKPVQFTVTVNSAAGTPAGRVSLFDGAAVIAGPVDLSAAGGLPRATFTVTTLAAGTHTLTARYEGGGNFGPAASAAVTHRVVAAGVTVGLAVAPSPAEEGAPVRLTATVSDPGGPVAPTGPVTFRVGGTVLGTVNLAAGAAALTTAAIPVGGQTVTAEYAGDGNFLPGSATAVAVVNRRTVVVPPSAPLPVLTGYREFAVGAGDGREGDARFFNPDGSERFGLNLFPGFTGGVRVTSADFTGDGVADLVAGTGPGAITQVRIVDGVSRQTVFSIQPFEAAFTRGVFVTTGDITGDGTPDLVITPDEGGGPRVRVFDGKGFGQLADFFGIDDPGFRGGARAGVGDMTGDGKADLVVSAGFGGGPRVAGFSGASLAAGGRERLFADFFVFEQGLRNGAYVTAGDLDGDGRADLVAGAGPGGGPRVLVLDAAGVLAGSGDGSKPLANYFAGNPDNRGGVRVAVRDLDGDTKADLVVGDGSGSGTRVTTYRGKAPTAADLSFDAFPGAMGGVFVG